MLLCCALSESELYSKNERIERVIMKMAKNGMGAMDELYELIKTDVYAFALSKTQNQKDAEDIMQDTFIQIYKYADRYEPQGKPLAWIFTIITNLSKRKFALGQRVSPMEDQHEDIPDDSDFASNLVDSEFLRALLNTLSQEEQEIIVLHIVSGMKHREIANLLDKPLSTVLSRYNRAIKKLQTVAEEEVYE